MSHVIRTEAPLAAPLALVGCDFRIAAAARRAPLVLDGPARRELLDSLGDAASGLVVLDTCGRTEWLAETAAPEDTAARLEAAMRSHWSGQPDLPAPYVHVGPAAARHALRVAVGLESFLPGEREIAGQWQSAMARARAEGASSPALHALGAAAGRLVRRVERRTRFREPGRSVARLVADLLAARGVGAGAQAGVVGRGEIGGRIAALLHERGLIVTGFTRSARLGEEPWHALGTLEARVAGLDALVVATAAPAPVVTRHDLAAARAILVVDLGLRPQVESVPQQASLVDLDALVASARAERAATAEDAARAQELVEVALAELLRDLASRKPGGPAGGRPWPSVAVRSS